MAVISETSTAVLSGGNVRLTGRMVWIVTVSSMEQIIGAGLSTLAGIIIPMLNLILRPELSAGIQGLAGAAGLVGIAIGSPVIGRMADKKGYLWFFRACPVIIILGSLLIYFTDDIWWTILGLFITGIGVGGGYSLDSAYISELMPSRWKMTMVGVAKASSALGFIGIAGLSYIIIKVYPHPQVWRALSLILTALGAVTFLMRLRWAQSPEWCARNGRYSEAEKASRFFYGTPVENKQSIPVGPVDGKEGYLGLFKGENLTRVIFSGIPWACEGVGVYGVGVFLPVLVMSLGLESPLVKGLPKVDDSVMLTMLINCFILVGFIAGLVLLSRMKHLKMLVQGFVLSAVGLTVILIGHIFKLPVWISLVGFLFFEFFLNVGPHLITFIIPSHIFPADYKAAGNGIAAFLGKAGAIAGVFLMPLLLRVGGVALVLCVCITVNLIGAIVARHYGRKLYNE